MSYQRYPGEVIDAEYVEVIPAQRGIGAHLLPRRTSVVMGEVMEEAMVLATHDRCLHDGAAVLQHDSRGGGAVSADCGRLRTASGGHGSEVVRMTLDDVLFIAVVAAAITWVIVKAVYDREVQHLRRENRMLWRLLSDQARLHEMSLDAYIAMLREAQRHMGGQPF